MEIPEFHLNDFTIDEDFEKEGGEANVYKGLHSTHGEVVIKRWFSASDDMKKEVELLKRNTYHQNIIQFLGILMNKKSKWIGYVMPYMPNGSLHDVIHEKSEQYDQKQIKSWITQICYGLSYLHGKKIIHRDIKPHNVLLGKSRDDVKLSDFGMAKSLGNISYAQTKAGTPIYEAPEVLRHEKYDKSIDIYSFSITIWEILHRRIPYYHIILELDLLSKIANGERPQLSNNLSAEMSDLLARSWHADASKRPTIHDILDFFNNTEFVYINLQNVVNECVTSSGNLNVHYNNEPLPQISLKKPMEKSSEKQAILLLGGIDGRNSDSLLMLENNGQNWNELNIKLPYAVSKHGAQFLNNNLYIFGGINTTYEPLNWTYKLSKSLQWEKMADMKRNRSSISNSSVILNNQIWVCGGWNREKRTLKSVEMYDSETNRWKYKKEMNKSRTYAAAAVINGKIFCSGGCNDDDLNSVECYDPSSDVWTLICNMPQSIYQHCAVEIDGNFIIMGGYDGKKFLKNVWALDTTDKNAIWIEKPSMSISRYLFSIAKIDGKVFVCGGETKEGDKYSTTKLIEIFDGEIWRNGPKMPSYRCFAPAAVIPVEFAGDLPRSSTCSIQ